MIFRQQKICLKNITIGAAIIVLSLFILDFGADRKSLPYYAQMADAANRMKRCIDSLQAMPSAQELDVQIDPNKTNLIGQEYSPITTTSGNLSAKRTATNPDFAALMVHWFQQLKLQPGDVVAVGCSGSFPALILATICATEAMKLQPIIIPSLGASSYGANRPDFTYLDIENALFQKGCIAQRSSAASPGGSGDIASDLAEDGRRLLQEAIIRNMVELINEPDVHKNLQKRVQIYSKKGVPKVFVNIGGAQINVGDYYSEKQLLPGINRRSITAENSVAAYYLQRGAPMIHLSKIEEIALVHGLPIDPQPLPEAGKSSLYFVANVSPLNKGMAIIGLFIAILLLFRAKRGDER